MISEMKYKRNNIICTGGDGMKTNVLVRMGDTKYINVNTLTDEEKKNAGNRMNRQAADSIVIVPKTA